MKKLFAIMLSIALAFTFVACQTNPKTETKYLQTSSTQEYIGVMTFRTETEYDSEGRQIKFTQYTNGEETSRVEYSYTDNATIGLTTQGDQTSTMKQVYEKDEAGNVIRIEMYIDDVLYSVTERTYDDVGNCLTNVQNTIVTEKIYTTTYTYDESGNQLTVTYDTGDGIGQRRENTYDENGKLLLTLQYDLNGNLTGREEYNWAIETAGVIEVFDGEGNLTSFMDVTYDEHGNLLESDTYDASSTLLSKISYTYEAFQVPVK